MKIEHPCNLWAASAGCENWGQAVEAMQAGRVLVGNAPRVGKTMIAFQLLHEEVDRLKLHTCSTEEGMLLIGLRESFSPEVLEDQRMQADRLFGN